MTHKEWIEHVVSVLYLNAMIELRSMENRRNYINDEYYKNYNRFTPVEFHKFKSYPEFINEDTF